MSRTKFDEIFRESKFQSRDDLPNFLNFLGLRGFGVEVGTHRGEYAEAILSRWHGDALICVDPWSNPPGYDDIISRSGRDRNLDYAEALNRLSRFGDKCQFLRMVSKNAAKLIGDGSLDFVYLDADHSYRAIAADLRLWWPKVKMGGVFSGHDLNNDWAHTVGRAVREFCEENKLTCCVVPGVMESWYILKQFDDANS